MSVAFLGHELTSQSQGQGDCELFVPLRETSSPRLERQKEIARQRIRDMFSFSARADGSCASLQ